MDAHKLIHQNSRVTDYYTPAIYTDFARMVMGSIDFDPASSELANIGMAGKFGVRATRYASEPSYTIITVKTLYGSNMTVREHGVSGHQMAWEGNVWLNHPFGRDEAPCTPNCKKKTCQERGWHTEGHLPGNKTWIETAVEKYRTGEATQIMLICFAALSADWFRPLLDFPMIVPRGRVNYYAINEDGKPELKRGVTKDSVLFYLGSNVEKFCDLGKKVGRIYLPFHP